MCATSHHFGDPQSPRYAQLDWMGGGLMSRQMMHAQPSAAIFVCESPWLWMGAGRRMGSPRKMAACAAGRTSQLGGAQPWLSTCRALRTIP
jgi:hypothetical protein